MKYRNFSFELRRDADLNCEIKVPDKLSDHLLIPFYSLVGFVVGTVLLPIYLVSYVFKHSTKPTKKQGGRKVKDEM